jgi:hypothetical protein
VKRRSDRCIETSDRCDLESVKGGMEAALEGDSFVVTGVGVSSEMGASNENPPCLDGK